MPTVNSRTAAAIPDYQSVKGNISVHVLERREGDITHFITLTFWESLEAIKGFAAKTWKSRNTIRRQGLFAGVRANRGAL